VALPVAVGGITKSELEKREKKRNIFLLAA